MSRSSNRKHLSPADKETLTQMYGTRCYVCGREEEIEWHHVKPLWMGGEDTFENMIPVCYWCHKAITKQMPKDGAHRRGGRPRKIPKGHEAVLDRYFRCEFGTKECIRQLKLKQGNHISDNTWYKKYKQDHGIDSFRNNIDLRLAKNGSVLKGEPAGKITYLEDGVERIIYAPHDIVSDKAQQMEFNFNAGSQGTGANEYRADRKPKRKIRPKLIQEPKKEVKPEPVEPPKPKIMTKSIGDVDANWWEEFKESKLFKNIG